MAILRIKEKSFKFKKIAIIAFCLVVFDAFITGLPFFGMTIAFFLVAASVISAFTFLFKNKQFSKLYAIKAVIYLMALISIIGIFKLNAYLGKEHAETVIIYPDNLNQLVPNYMNRIPKCAYRIMDNEFRYYANPDDVYLMWTVIPPWGRKQYDFKTAEWRYFD